MSIPGAATPRGILCGNFGTEVPAYLRSGKYGDSGAALHSSRQFAEAISVRVDRQVIDKTGLPGRYDFTTTLPLAHYNPNTDAADSPVPKTFDAVKALGLNLVSARELTGGIILDHIDRPPEN